MINNCPNAQSARIITYAQESDTNGLFRPSHARQAIYFGQDKALTYLHVRRVTFTGLSQGRGDLKPRVVKRVAKIDHRNA